VTTVRSQAFANALFARHAKTTGKAFDDCQRRWSLCREVSTLPRDTGGMELCELRVNGEAVTVATPAHWTLLELLRYRLGLTGTKQGCDKGDCGACTVQLDGKPVLSCLTLALEARGHDVRTVEGLGRGGRPHPLQDAFDRHGAAQCGFCTPGMLMSSDALLTELSAKGARGVTREVIAEALGGNLCRCTGYVKILDAVVDAAAQVLARGEPHDR